jgi:hypothetical protein
LPKPKSINDLLRGGGPRIGALAARAEARRTTLEHVRAALSPALAATVVSAGLEHGQLTVGVADASWASRLRYATDTLRQRVSGSLGTLVVRVRIRVVPPRA